MVGGGLLSMASVVLYDSRVLLGCEPTDLCRDFLISIASIHKATKNYTSNERVLSE